jgi:hypothetical protein
VIRGFTSDGATVVGKIDKLLFGRDVDLWIAVLHDFRFFVGGDAATFFAANAEFREAIRLYSDMPWRAAHRWAGVTLFAWGWLPTKSRWGFGWKYPQTKGDPRIDGPYTVRTEWPVALRAIKAAGCPEEVFLKLRPVLGEAS